MKLSDIKPNKDNPRVIKDERFKKLVNSIKEFPKMMRLRPIVVDDDNMVLGGNMRLRALQQLGYTEIPDEWVAKADDLTEEEIKRFIIVDNVGFGENDMDMLANEWNLEDLDNWGMDIKDLKIGTEVEEDEVPEVDEESEPVSKLGEVYQLGRHRLMCGDSTKIEDVEKLMNGQKADMVFTDPPYNIGFSYNQHQDKMKFDDYKEFCKRFYELLDCEKTVITPGPKNLPIWYEIINIKDIGWSKEENDFIYDEGVWDKSNTRSGASCFYLRRCEPIIFVGKFDKKRNTDLFEYSRIINKELTNSQKESNVVNVAPGKPNKFVADIVNSFSKENDIIKDVFGGNGTTLIACEQLNRKCYMMELDPKYIDVIIKRWEQFTGNKAKKL